MKPPADTAGSAVRWIHERAAHLDLDYGTIAAAVPEASYQRIVNYFVRDTLAPDAVPLLAGPLRLTEAEQLDLYTKIMADRVARRAPDAARADEADDVVRAAFVAARAGA